MTEMEHLTAALQAFLAKHDIAGRAPVGLVIVSPDHDTAARIDAAIKRDASFLTHEFYRQVDFPHATAVINGIPVVVQVPKLSVQV